MIAHQSYVVCDRCGAPGPLGDDATEARALARRAGFERRNWNRRIKDVCTGCKTQTKVVES